MGRPRDKVTCLLAILALAACDGDAGGGDAGGGTAMTVGEVRAGEGLTGGGTGDVVSLAVDFSKVARATHTHAFSEITGVPDDSTPGATCPAGDKATGVNVAMGTVSCEPDRDSLGALDCRDGDVPELRDGVWTCGASAGGVTSITAGAGLLGGTITDTGTLSVDFTAVAPAGHTHPELASPWTLVADGAIEYSGSVGIGRNPVVALEVDGVDGQLYLHDRAGGNSAGVILEDTDGSGGTLNIAFRRLDAGDLAASATIFLATDNSLAYQTEGTAHRFKVSPSMEAMRIDADGFVGIGTKTPAHLLEVSNGSATAYCDGASWVNASSRAFKQGIHAFAADDYRRVRRWLDETQVVWYRYRGDPDPRTRVGLIAEDVPAVLATADRKGISTADAIGFLTAATKELSDENRRLRRENEALSGRLASLERRLARLERRR